MKYKKILIFSLFVALLVLTSCQQSTGPSSSGAYIGGTQGVMADFEAFGVEEDGLYNIFDTESFPIEVTLKNKGEYEIQPGEIVVKLLGPAEEEFSGLASRQLANVEILDKISELVPTGGEETVTFATDAQYQSEVTGLVDRQWFANVEYHYQTYALVPEVCLKEDLTDARVCEVKETKDFSVSGAPITITAVEESTAGKGIMALKFMVSNVGGGESAKVGQEFAVNDRLAYSLDDPAWECKSAGKVNEARLIDGQAEIVCKLKEALAENTLSTKQVKLTLDYTYRDLIQETVRIKESG